jgi:hypothetical protein
MMTVCVVNRLINNHCYELAVLYLSFETSELSVATCFQIWRGATAGNGLLNRQLEQSKTRSGFELDAGQKTPCIKYQHVMQPSAGPRPSRALTNTLNDSSVPQKTDSS